MARGLLREATCGRDATEYEPIGIGRRSVVTASNDSTSSHFPRATTGNGSSCNFSYDTAGCGSAGYCTSAATPTDSPAASTTDLGF